MRTGRSGVLTLSARDLRAALELAADLAACDDWSDLASAMPRLAERVGADGVVYHEVDPSTPREWTIPWPWDAYPLQVLTGYPEVFGEHPFVTHFPSLAASGVLRLSDLLSRPAWRSSRVYSESLRSIGADDQLGCVVGMHADSWKAVTCIRTGRPFSVKERTMLEVLRPHLSAVLRRLREHTESPLGIETLPFAHYGHAPSAAHDAGSRLRLTARESQVLASLGQGRSRSAVAKTLGCSPRTVDKHVENIHEKLGVSSTIEALHRWRQERR